MNIKSKFLELTSRTYPHGTERDIFPLLEQDLNEDEFGNLFTKIGESDVMFTSHLDTATSSMTTIVHVIEGNMIKTDGKTILGADDKAGVVIMLNMIKNRIPGLYYFFIGEEVGCIGSRKLSSKYETEKIVGINKVISFDRRGTSSVITYQSGSRCCSDKFGQALCDELNKNDSTFDFKNDKTGLLTDSIQFVSLYSECTNISVGYQNEHTFSEVQNIEFLDKLAQACLLVNWNDLPTERDPSTKDYNDPYDSYEAYGYGWGGYSGRTPNYSGYIKEDIIKTEKVWFHDKKFNYVSSLDILKSSKKVLSVDLCQERIDYEHNIIDDLLRALELSYEFSTWDGFTLKVNYDGLFHIKESDRNDLMEYLPELDYTDGNDIGGVESEYGGLYD